MTSPLKSVGIGVLIIQSHRALQRNDLIYQNVSVCIHVPQSKSKCSFLSSGDSLNPGHVYSNGSVLNIQWDDKMIVENFHFSYTSVLPESKVMKVCYQWLLLPMFARSETYIH